MLLMIEKGLDNAELDLLLNSMGHTVLDVLNNVDCFVLYLSDGK